MKIVGVTSCISGLALTPMAAKSLEKAGKKMGIDVKIEQQGAIGIINEVTAEDVKDAAAIIIAADGAINNEERFEGKLIVYVKLGEVVANGETILEKVIKKVEAGK